MMFQIFKNREEWVVRRTEAEDAEARAGANGKLRSLWQKSSFQQLYFAIWVTTVL